MDAVHRSYARLEYGTGAADEFNVPSFAELSTTSRFVLDQPTDTFDEAVKLPPLPKLDQAPTSEAAEHQPDLALDLPDLSDLADLADLELEPLDESEQDTEPLHVSESDSRQLPALEPLADEDVWQLTQKLPRLSVEPRFLTWDAFLRPGLDPKPKPNFISEAGPAAFDACLTRRSRESPKKPPAGSPIQPRALLRSLWQLGLGRDSILFPFNKERNRFVQAVDGTRWSGCSLECSQDLIGIFLRMGNTVRELKSFVDIAFAANGILPAVVALAHAVDVILETIETFATEAYADIRSLLQLQDLFEPMQKLVAALAHLAKEAEHCTTGSEFLNAVFAFVQNNEFGSGAYRRVLERILARTSADWLSTVADQVGFRQAILRSGIQSLEDDDDSDVWSGPAFIHEEDRQLISDTRTCLYYVQTQHPHHPILEARSDKNGSVELSLGFDWDDLERLQKKASNYQESVVNAMRDCSLRSTAVDECNKSTKEPTMSEFTFEAFQSNLMQAVEQADRPPSRQSRVYNPLTDHDQLPDELRDAVLQFLSSSNLPANEDTNLQPPFSLAPSLSLRSLLRTQNHLLSYITAHSLLHEQGLRTHLELHHSFSLFASGLFSARLQHVLFSSETETAERSSGKLRIGSSGRSGGMGLKLGTGERRTWPPASSEVRLALMGLLGDCWREEQNLNSKFPPQTTPRISKATTGANTLDFTGDDSLPGNLSFSIRTNLPDEAVERILNAESIAALDFLRLTYDPPAALAPLFSPRTLDLYDRIFTLWLRLTRMTSTLATLFTQCQRLTKQHAPETHLLRHEAHVFLTTVTAHLRLAAVEGPWTAFAASLDALAARCADPCPPAPDAAAAHPRPFAALRALHDAALARVSAGLLLRRRQRRAADALEAACEDVLEFARALRPGRESQEAGPVRSVRELRASFRGHVADFKGACGAVVAEREARGGVEEADEARALKELLGVLDGYRA